VGWPLERGEQGPTVAVPLPGGREQQSVQDYLDFAAAVGLPLPPGPPPAPRLHADAERRAAGARWLAGQGAAGATLFVLGIGGGNDRKRWPLERYLELGAWLEELSGGRAIFFCGPRERRVAHALRAALPRALVAESLPLDLCKGIIGGAQLAVCNDHAIMHLSASLGVPTVGVFLASNPAEWFPYGPPSSFVIGPPLPCRPCYVESCDGWECNDPSLMSRVRACIEAWGDLLGAARS
jgi:ADP-heptose:LPS heptosyltransferase